MTVYRVEDVSFSSQGDRVAGRLFLPDRPAADTRAFVALGPVSSVKEQAPLQYATRLARAGHAALIFDPRGFGASGGLPRQFDDAAGRSADVRAAVDVLATHPEIDAARIGGLGICMGCNWMAQAVADDDRLRHATFVAGAYSIRSRRVALAGGQDAFDRQLAAYRKVLERHAADGTVEYHTLVAAEMADSYFSWAVPYHWYRMWTDPGPLRYKGGWENRLATISDHAHYAFDVCEPFMRIDVPTLVVNSTDSATPLPAVEDLFALLPGPGHRLVVTGDEIQVQFYDDPVTIDHVVDAIVAADV